METVVVRLKQTYNPQKIAECLENADVKHYEIKQNNIIVHTHLYNIQTLCRNLIRNGYEVTEAVWQKNSRFIHLIEAYFDKKQIEEEIIRENNEFDLEDFYVNELEGAICVITKDKTIFANAVASHYNALNAIYNLLYNDSNQMDYYCLSDEDDTFWQNEAVQYGNVIIQLCSNVSSTVWLPAELNNYQKQELHLILEQINDISQQYDIPIPIDTEAPQSLKDDSVLDCEIIQKNFK